MSLVAAPERAENFLSGRGTAVWKAFLTMALLAFQKIANLLQAFRS